MTDSSASRISRTPADEAELPRHARPVERVEAPDLLAQPSVVGDRRLQLSGRRARAVVHERRGVERFEADGRAGIAGVRILDLAPANVVRAPRLLRRELAGRQGSVVESLLLPDGLPGMILQWERLAGPAEAAPVEIALTPLPGVETVRLATDGHGLVAEGGGLRLRVVVIGADFETSEVEGEVRLRLQLPVGQPITLLALLDPVDERGASLPALAAVPAHRRRAELDAEGSGHGGLRIRTGVDEIDDGVRFVRARLRDRLAGPPGAEDRLHPPVGGGEEDAPRRLWLVRGALASGDWETARAALLSLPPGPEALLGWCRWIGWTGRHHLLLDHRAEIEAGLEGLEVLPAFTAERLRKAVADAVEAAGEEEWAERLRSAGGAEGVQPEASDSGGTAASGEMVTPEKPAVSDPATADTPPPAPGGGMKLPMVGGGMKLPMVGGGPVRESGPSFDAGRSAASAGPPAPRLPAAPDVALAAELGLPVPTGAAKAVGTPPDPGTHPVAAAGWSLRAWTLGLDDEGYPPFRAVLGGWGEGAPADDVSGAAAIAALVEGMLGVRPDAAYGRIRIAPVLPSGWSSFGVEGITVEKIRIGMRYRRTEGRHEFVFVPEAGSVPGMLIFEPRVPGTAVREVRIDGEVAEVASERSGDRVQLQVQLPADGERRIEIDVVSSPPS